MKNYRLAVDENGSPFVLNSKGSIDFGYITEEMNLSPAPIRVVEGDDKYGLTHVFLKYQVANITTLYSYVCFKMKAIGK